MALARWSQQYVTGNDLVDTQHQELFRIMNELHESRKLGKGQDQVKATLASLVNYTVHHFRCEEKLMQDHGYPEFAAHKKIHDELTQRVRQLAADDKTPLNVLCAKISEFLSNWLGAHINAVDRKVIAFITAKQAGATARAGA